MVNEAVLIRDKKRGLKKFLKVFIVVLLVALFLVLVYYAVYGIYLSKSGGDKIIVENPIKNLVIKYGTVSNGNIEITKEEEVKIVGEAVLGFNEEYIDYILLALGVQKLRKSPTMQNPKIEIDVGEIWSSEIKKGVPETKKESIDDEDIRIIISKEEAVRALLSDDIREFMKSSVSEGRTSIEMVAGKAELFSKGYLKLYTDLTGEEIV